MTQNSRDLSHEHADASIPPPPKAITSETSRLYNLVFDFNENTNLIEFLRGIQYNFSLD